MKNGLHFLVLCVLLCGCQSNTTLFITLSEVQGLQVGDALETSGLKIGTITAIEFADDFNSMVLTTILDENITIPVDSEFKIKSVDILGTKAIDVTYSNARDFYQSGDTINGQIQDFHFESIYLKTLEGLAPSLFRTDSSGTSVNCF